MVRLGLRRRWSLRRILLFGSGFVIFLFLFASLTPVTSPLPPYTGPHEVGVLDVEVGVERRVVHEAVLKETGERAFELHTLALTLYYPSSPPRTTPKDPAPRQPLARPWLPQPISLIGKGYARIAGVHFPPLQNLFTAGLWLFGRNTVIPGSVDAPLLSPRDHLPVGGVNVGDSSLGKIIGGEGKEKLVEEVLELRERMSEEGDGVGDLPCVVFTHGMAGMSQSYSHYLGSIASHGYVVAAVEHRDGSGPGTVIHGKDGKKATVWHLEVDDLDHSPALNLSTLQQAQLAFREAEIHETIALFHSLHWGTSSPQNLKPYSPQSSTLFSSLKSRLNTSAITIAGHSYGATGALQALKTAPSATMPINGGIALDPGKGSGTLNTDIDVPVLVMQSGSWTEKQTEFYELGWHFDVVKKLVKGSGKGWFTTLAGTAHPSCTDAPLIVPWIMKMVTGTSLNARVALAEYIDVSVEFLEYLRNGEKKGVLKSQILSPNGPLGKEEMRKMVRGKEGAAWEVHVIPEPGQ
ncbi:platelet-activating factor acetylhydrolase, isoform II-domain-containing protein [Clohesyomyces aquaticus]|uniref:Putative phospholipase n=1 Tax=Clohesyomyces aquaticus TaxID=1231657 RepID=A0A1Y1XXW4_9PLEO|nr:platelet-activating factor acetylhydrolase, isoform II-domain-containing protein [Clohesyomyces aquaticus]